MALLQLLGELVNLETKVDEKTALAIREILEERKYQDKKYGRELGGMPPTASANELAEALLVVDKKWSGTDWNGFIDRYQAKVTPDMSDPETRKMFVKIAALALAALRAN